MNLTKKLLAHILITSMMLIPWLAWETNPNQIRRWAYPFKGQLVAWFTNCTQNSPEWLYMLSQDMAIHYNSPANQLAFSNSNGELFSCVNGWEGMPFVSSSVVHDTPMRLASLSKIISFTGIIGVDKSTQSNWLNMRLIDAISLSPALSDERIKQIKIRHLLSHSAGFDRIKTEDPITKFRHKPWCPYNLDLLANIYLDYPPTTKYSYHNLDYCLAEAAYSHWFGKSLWNSLNENFKIHKYGLDWLKNKDSPVTYNFMHENLTGYSSSFINEIDWKAARASMGMTGNATGLARFIQDNYHLISFSKNMRDDTISCNEEEDGSCFDGFLNRVKVGKTKLWQQSGYLYGMSALFLTDDRGNFIVWIGAGESRPLSSATQHIQQTLLKNITSAKNDF